jgi:hypothetical protein
MAETAGLVVGAVSLAGLLASAIDCFQYVQNAKTLDRDFATVQLRLDEASLRLSRWGEAIGIGSSVGGSISTDRCMKAEKVLKHISNLFRHAEDKYDTYGDTDTATYEAVRDLGRLQHGVHKGIVTKVQKRINHKFGTLAKKTKWALYDKKDLESLVEGIVQAVTTLELLLPASEGESHIILRSAAELELKEIHDIVNEGQDEETVTVIDVAETLENAVTSIDPYMEEVVKKLIEAAKPRTSEASAVYNIKQQFGNVDGNQGIIVGYGSGNSVNNYK